MPGTSSSTCFRFHFVGSKTNHNKPVTRAVLCVQMDFPDRQAEQWKLFPRLAVISGVKLYGGKAENVKINCKCVANSVEVREPPCFFFKAKSRFRHGYSYSPEVRCLSVYLSVPNVKFMFIRSRKSSARSPGIWCADQCKKKARTESVSRLNCSFRNCNCSGIFQLAARHV